MQYKTLKINKLHNYTEIRLNRPEVKNAMNGEMLDEINFLFDDLLQATSTNLILLRGEGSVFSAGADLNWMADSVHLTNEENVAESKKLFQCFDKFSRIPATTVAWLNGPAIGGALGIAAAADFVWSSIEAYIQFSEVKLGLVPATIAPFIVNRVGSQKAKQWMITARKIETIEQKQSNFADAIVEAEQLPDQLDKLIDLTKANDNTAIGLTKNLIADLTQNAISEPLGFHTSNIIANVRASNTAQERMKKFLSSKSFKS